MKAKDVYTNGDRGIARLSQPKPWNRTLTYVLNGALIAPWSNGNVDFMKTRTVVLSFARNPSGTILLAEVATNAGNVPKGIDPAAALMDLESLPGVVEVHDLPTWGMSTTEAVLTAHVVLPGLTNDDALLSRTRKELRDRFGIEHATLQLEHGSVGYPCHLAPADRV